MSLAGRQSETRAFYCPEAAENSMGLPSVLLPLFAPWADLCLLHRFKPPCLSVQTRTEPGICLSPEEESTLLGLKHQTGTKSPFGLLVRLVWMGLHHSTQRGAQGPSRGKTLMLHVCQEYTCLSPTVPELSLPCQPDLGLFFTAHCYVWPKHLVFSWEQVW